MSAESVEPQKWALLIGIEQYRHFSPLAGCVNDVRVMADMLIDHFDFPPSHVVQILDEVATQEGIRASWEQLLTRVGKDDVVVIHYSGHGSQVRDEEGDEADEWDETIVPYDSGRGELPNRDITDDEIYEWLRHLANVTTNLTLVFDSCHSGNVTRDPFGAKARWAPRDERPRRRLPRSPAARSVLATRHARDGASGWLPVSRSYTVFAACRSDEIAFEATIEEGGSEISHGILTYFLLQELRKARPGTTYRDVFEAVAPQVTGIYPSQHPQLEGAWDRQLFGLADFEPMRYLPVRERAGARVMLGGGVASGVTVGSRWSIYRSGTKRARGRVKLGTVMIEETGAATSRGSILRESSPGAVKEGGRAVEESRTSKAPTLTVEVSSPEELARKAAELEQEIGRSFTLRQAGSRTRAEARVYLLPSRKEVQPGDPVPRLGALSEPTLAVVGRGDDLLLPLHGVHERGVMTVIRENLEKLARYRYAVGLQDPEGPLRGDVVLCLLRRSQDGSWRRARRSRGEIEYLEDDHLAFSVTNKSSRPLYLAVLDFGLTGRITLVYPAGRAQKPLAPGRTLEVGTRPGEEMALEIPGGFPLNPWSSPDEGGVETLKLFATSQELNLDLITQGTYRGKEETSPLRHLLELALWTAPTRDLPAGQIRPGEDLWTTVQESFRLKPRLQASRRSPRAAIAEALMNRTA